MTDLKQAFKRVSWQGAVNMASNPLPFSPVCTPPRNYLQPLQCPPHCGCPAEFNTDMFPMQQDFYNTQPAQCTPNPNQASMCTGGALATQSQLPPDQTAQRLANQAEQLCGDCRSTRATQRLRGSSMESCCTPCSSGRRDARCYGFYQQATCNDGSSEEDDDDMESSLDLVRRVPHKTPSTTTHTWRRMVDQVADALASRMGRTPSAMGATYAQGLVPQAYHPGSWSAPQQVIVVLLVVLVFMVGMLLWRR